MIELEVQALSITREGLLIDIGKCVVASGFTLHRQRLVQDPNGVLVTLVVRGPARKQRELEAALGANERIVSFEIAEHEEGAQKPHFAAARTFVRPPVAPAPPPVAEVAPKPAPAPVAVEPTKTLAQPPAVPMVPVEPAPSPQPEPEPDFMFMLEPKPAPPKAPPSLPIEPFVEVISLGPDEAVVEKMLPRLQFDYPKVFPSLQKLEESVVEAARESSLLLVGQRTGAWLFARDYASNTKLSLDDAIRKIGVPALSAVLDVEYKGEGLHINHSPLCTAGHSGCKFFSGYLEGLLGPVVASGNLSIFEVCCRSFGADACVLAISD
jgi:hypothetical protein